MKGLISLYSWRFAPALVYMLQSTEYQVGPYLRWFWRVQDFGTVMHRRTLDRTRPASLLLMALCTGMLAQIAAGVFVLAGCVMFGWPFWYIGAALLITYPIVWAHLAALPLWLGRQLIINPRQRAAVRRAEKIFAAHAGVKVAVAGSYGKTSMKELLLTVLREGKKVAATPANKNVAVSHAIFAGKLDGDEDILVIEYGEGEPGDVGRFAELTHPTHAVITGLAPAHLDRYKTLERAAQDIFSVAGHVPAGKTYVNAASPDAKQYITDDMQPYDEHRVLGWTISGIELSADGTAFVMERDGRKVPLHSGLLGRHQVGPLAFAAAFALDMGLTEEQVAAGVAKAVPYEHRMQPYRLNGAWVIDDTYNGNLEGVRAGTALLRELPASRKWYVTPGLVDQGRETARVHREMGELIASAAPDTVVLMDNSVTDFIAEGLKAGGFGGELRIESDPLHFYTNMQHFLAAGDLVLMQNDWTDNYH